MAGYNRVRVTGTDFDALRMRVLSLPDQITDEIEDGMRDIAADAVRSMRKRIEDMGRVRSKGDPSLKYRPRVGGKSMRDHVDQEVRRNHRSVSMRFGWIKGVPGYAYWQEFGTSNGVKGMHALTDAKLVADIQLKALLKRI